MTNQTRGAELKKLLTAKKIRQHELAAATGLASSQVSRLVGGYECFGPSTRTKLEEGLKKLGCKVKEIKPIIAD